MAKESKRRIVAEFSARNTAKGTVLAFEKNMSRVNKVLLSGDKIAHQYSLTMGRVGKVAKLTLTPLKALAAATVAIKGVTLAAGIASVKAAADYETFRQQLRTVIDTKEAADRAFQESLDFSVATPFTPDQIVQTRIALEGVGVKGAEAVMNVAEAAAALDRNILDVAKAVKSMEAEPLRNLNVLFELRDRAGNQFRKDAESFRAAQQAVLDIFNEKYGGGVGRMSVTWKGLVSTLQGVTKDLRATFGQGFLAESKLFINDIIEGVKEIRTNARQAGLNFGDEMMRARSIIMAGFDVALQVAQQIRDTLATKNGLGTVIHEAFASGATLVGQGIVSAFKVSLPLWKTVGSVLGQGVLSAYYRSDVWGAQGAREGAIRRNLQTKPLSDLQDMAKQFGISRIGGGNIVNTYTPMKRRDTTWVIKNQEVLARNLAEAIGKLNVEQQLAYAEFDPAQTITRNIVEAQSAIRQEMQTLKDVALGSFQEFSNAMAEASGTDKINIAQAYVEAMQARTAEGQKNIAAWRAKLENIKKNQAPSTPGSDGASAAASTKVFDTAAAYNRMFGQMQRMTESNAQQQRRILNQLKADYEGHAMDRLVIDQWYHEQVQQLDIKRLQASKRFFDGFKAASLQMQRDTRTWGEIGFDTAMTMEQGFATAFERIGNKTQSVTDAMKNMIREVGEEFARLAVYQPAAKALAGGLSGFVGSFAGNLFGGGINPSTGAPNGNFDVQPAPTNPFDFSNVLQGFSRGGISNEPAIFAEGSMAEAAVPLPDGRSIPVTLRGGSGGGIHTVNINNTNQGPPMEFSVQDMIQENGILTIDTFTTRVREGGELTRSVRDAVTN